MADSLVVGILRVLLTANSAEFDAAMKKASDTAKVWSNDLKKIGRDAEQLGKALTTTVTLPLLGLGAGAIKVASDFESSFAGVRKTVDGVVDDTGQLTAVGKQIQDGLRQMATEIPISVNGLASVAEAAGQLGIKKEDILDFTRTMAALGVTTNLTADEAATATAQIQNIFGAAGKDVDRFGATLVALGNAGASTEKDIIAMGLRIAGAGNQVGLTQDQVLAFASALSSVGINAEAGGSAISRVFLKINDAVAKGGGDLTEFARVSGMSASQFKKAFQTDAAGATVAFISGLNRIKGEGENVNGVIEGLMGKNIILKSTLMSAAGAGDLLSDSLRLGAEAWQSNTALTKEATERYKTFESQLTVLWNQLKDVGITIGTALLPAFKDLITAVQPLVRFAADLAAAFAKLPEPVRLVGVGIGAIAIATGPAILVVGQLASAASTMVGAFATGGILAGAPAAIRAIGASALAATPAILGVAAALAGVAMLGKIGYEAWGLYTDRQEQARLATEQNKSHQLALAEASKIAGREITNLNHAYIILRSRAMELRAETEKQTKAQADANAQTTVAVQDTPKLSEILRNLQQKVRDLDAAQRAEIDAGLRANLTTKQLIEAFNKLYPSVGLTEQMLDLYKDTVKAAGERSKDAAEAASRFAQRMADLALQVRDQNAAIAAQSKANQDWGVGAKTWTEWLDRINSLQSRTLQDTAALTKALEEWAQKNRAVLAPAMIGYTGNLNQANEKTQENTKSTETWKSKLSDLASAFAQLAQVSGGSLSGLAKAIGTVINTLEIGVQAGQTFVKGFNEALKGGAKNLATGIAGLATGLVSGIGGVMGATSTGTALQRAIGGAISGAGFGATVGAGIGAAIASNAASGAAMGGVWGLAAGAIVGIFIGVFRGRDTRREMELVGEEWGIAISEGMAKKIKKAAEETFRGNREAARTFLLGDMITEAGGLNAVNFDQFAGRLRDVFVMMQRGLFDAAQAAHVLDENWASFVKQGTDASGRLSDRLREILFLARANGVESQALTEYTREQSQVAIDGFGGIVAASGQAREGYARLAEGVRAAQADIDKLRDAGITGGAEMEAAQRRLTDALTAQQSAAASASEELSDMGLIAVGVYAAAIANGLSHAEAIEAAGPAIMEVTQAYRDLGLDIDNAAFRALSLQAELQQRNPQLVAGVNSLSKSFIALSNTNSLNVESFRAMERMGLQMYSRLQGEVAALGGTSADALLPMQDYLHQAEKQAKLLGIPLDENTQMLIDQSKELGIWQEEGRTAAEQVTDSMNALVDAVKELVDQLRAIPPRVNTTVTTTYRTEGEPPPPVEAPDYTAVPNFRRGSDGLRDFGAGTLAMLHGREAVIPESDLSAVGGGASVHVNVDARGALFDSTGVQRLAQRIGEEVQKLGSFSRVSFGFAGAR